jgi:hypothetical protein
MVAVVEQIVYQTGLFRQESEQLVCRKSRDIGAIGFLNPTRISMTSQMAAR